MLRQLAIALLALANVAHATEAPSESVDAKIDAIATRASQLATRTFGKSASFCSEQQLPAHVQMNERLAQDVATIATATHDALVEMVRVDPTFLETMPAIHEEELAAGDRQGDELLRMAHADPLIGCSTLATSLAPHTVEDFKADLLASFKGRAATRAKHCAATPRPADCP